MRIINLENKSSTETTPVEAAWNSQVSPVTHTSYHELADTPVVEKDALAQLHTNIEMLADLQGRLAFVMREVRYLMKV